MSRRPCARCERLRERCPRCRAELGALNGTPDRAAQAVFRAARAAVYRLSLEQYEQMIEDQGGACAICGRRPEFVDDLLIDHNHATGAVRGLLCHNCNVGIGQLQDSPDVLEAAIRYLEERGCYGPDALAEEHS